MNTTYNKSLKGNAQRLRREMTPEERHLWYDFLKFFPLPVARQKIIGNYIVDFCCPGAKLVIELDGSQHYEAKAKQADAERDAFLISLGYTVLRYSNLDIAQNFKAVCLDIETHVKKAGKQCLVERE